MKVTARIVLLICFSLVFSFQATLANETKAHTVEIQTLNFLKVIPQSSYNDGELNENMSSAEFIQIVKKLFKFDDVYKNVDFASIIDLNNIDINTQKEVNLQDAITIILKCLGYTDYANQRGGYPNGYYSVAQSNNLISGISKNMSENLTFNDVIMLLYNTLNQNCMVTLSNYAPSFSYTIEKGEKVLERVYKYQKLSGVITSDAFTALDSTSTLKGDHQVIIDNIIYDMKCEYSDSYMGRNVEFFVNVDEPNKIYFMYKNQNKNNELKIQVDLFSGLKDNTIEYYGDDTQPKIIKAGLVKNANVIRNGAYIGKIGTGTINESNFKFNSGYVTLVDNNNDGTYEIVLISDYTTYVLSSKSSVNKVVNDKYGLSPLILSRQGQDITYNIFQNGIKTDVSYLEEWTVLSVSEFPTSNTNKRKFNIEVSCNEVTGTIDEIIENNKKLEVTINGVTYKVSENYYSGGKYNKNAYDLKCGQMVTAFLTVDNKIAAVSTSVIIREKTGYLIKFGEKKSLANKYEFKIFEDDNKNGKMKIYNSANNLKVNDLKDSDLYISLIALGRNNVPILSSLGEKAYNQLIKYKVNDKGEIFEIKTAKWSDEPAKDDFYLNFVSESAPYSFPLFSEMYGFDLYSGRRYFIPEDLEKDSEYKIMYPREGLLNKNLTYNVKLYNLKKDYFCDIAVIRETRVRSMTEALSYLKSVQTNDSDSLLIYEGHLIVKSISKALDRNGDLATKVTFFYRGAEVSYIVPDDVLQLAMPLDNKSTTSIEGFDKQELSVGDVVRIYPNWRTEKELLALYVMYSPSQKIFCKKNTFIKDSYDVLSGSSATWQLTDKGWMFGEVIKSQYRYINVTTRNPLYSSKMFFQDQYLGRDSLYVFDSKTQKVSVASYDDVMIGDKVFVGFSDYRKTADIFVFR